ncbi:ArsR/SmtB family transcription factor [Streptomyces sp. IBSNAI002]|uniref:ArsR/SmtB family transcription factor n=1 Tax=Streptomyces sp. IBSNAI002 TaxID=3457500 RepID=UPI003FD6B28E
MSETPPPPGNQPHVRTLDAHALRGLAHPLRMRLLAALRLDGPATASQLAAKLGESSGATSYHLRQLAAHGFVEDAPERGKGRERWWKSSHEGTALDEGQIHADDAVTRGAADVFLAEIARNHTQELNTWLGTAHEWPAEWRGAADLSDFTLRLTAAQSVELIGKLHDLINSYRDLPPPETGSDAGADSDSDSDGREAVRFHTHVLPRRTPR